MKIVVLLYIHSFFFLFNLDDICWPCRPCTRLIWRMHRPRTKCSKDTRKPLEENSAIAQIKWTRVANILWNWKKATKKSQTWKWKSTPRVLYSYRSIEWDKIHKDALTQTCGYISVHWHLSTVLTAFYSLSSHQPRLFTSLSHPLLWIAKVCHSIHSIQLSIDFDFTIESNSILRKKLTSNY